MLKRVSTRAGAHRRPPGSIRTRLLSASDSRPVEQSTPSVAVGIGDGQRRLGRPAAGEDARAAGTAPFRRRSAGRGSRRSRRAASAAARAGRGRRRRGRGCGRDARGSRPGSGGGRARRPARSPGAGRRGARRWRGSRRRLSASRARSGRLRSGAVHEQGDAGLEVERGHGLAPLARDAQQLPARDQHADVRGAERAMPATTSAPFGQELLEVVEQQERRPLPKVDTERLVHRAVDRFAHPERRGPIGGSSVASRTAARSTNQTPWGKRSRTLRATARASRVLPLPPGPLEGHDAALAQVLGEMLDLFLAAHERGYVTGQVGGHLARAQGSLVVGRAGHDEAIESAGSSKSLTARSPSSTSRTPVSPGRSASWGGSRSTRAAERTTCPPFAAAVMRAA